MNTTTELIPNDESLLEILAKNKQDFETMFFEYLKKGEDEAQLTFSINLQAIASLFYTIYSGIRVVSKVHPDKKKLIDSINIVLAVLE